MSIKTLKDLLEYIMSNKTPSYMDVDLGGPLTYALYGVKNLGGKEYNFEIYAVEDDYFILTKAKIPRELSILPIACLVRIWIDKDLLRLQ